MQGGAELQAGVVAAICALLALLIAGLALYVWGRRHGASRSARPRSLVTAGLRPGDRCLYCHEEAAEEMACARCAAHHHDACWDERIQCAACGAVARLGWLERTPGRAAIPQHEGLK